MRKRDGWPLRLAGIIVAIVVIGPLVWLVAHTWGLYEDATGTTERAAVLQALAAIGALVATVLLLGMTFWQTSVSREMARKAGPIVSCELRMAWLQQTGGGAITGPIGALATGSPDPLYPDPYMAVLVRNTGGAGIVVDSASIEFESGMAWAEPGTSVGESPPFELGAHSSKTLFISYDGANACAHAQKVLKPKAGRKVRAQVSLSSGQTIRSGWEVLPVLPGWQ